jgi:hypothetical protein
MKNCQWSENVEHPRARLGRQAIPVRRGTRCCPVITDPCGSLGLERPISVPSICSWARDWRGIAERGEPSYLNNYLNSFAYAVLPPRSHFFSHGGSMILGRRLSARVLSPPRLFNSYDCSILPYLRFTATFTTLPTMCPTYT